MIGFDRQRRTSQARRLGLGIAAAGTAVAASQAEADVITSGVVNQVVSDISTPFQLDLNGDSDADFTFATITDAKAGTQGVEVSVEGANRVLGGKFPVRLSANALIDNTASFSSGDAITHLSDTTEWEAPFPTSGFMGVRLTTGDKTGFSDFFGWIEITANSDTEIVLNQWAFEDQSGVGILAGSTNSLATVPEPSTVAIIAAAGIGYFARRFLRKRNGADADERM